MKGAKPKHNAIRRGLSDSYGLAVSDDSSGVLMPQDIAQDPVQSEIWAWLAPPVNNFTEQDIPTLRLLTYWHAVAQQAEQAIPVTSNFCFKGEHLLFLLNIKKFLFDYFTHNFN